MSQRVKFIPLGLMLALFGFSPAMQAAVPPVDYNCLTNQPGLSMTCPGYVPDLCALAANCASTNYLPGSCTQGFPPGMPLVAGNYSLSLQVMDLQSNVFNYAVPFNVLPQVPPPGLSVTCPMDKTVECGSGWSFDAPVVLTSCCGVNITTSDNVISNGVCSQIITRTWQILDGCGNVKVCNQTVTTVDTTPPGGQCGANLVPNGSFERFTNCPNANSLFDLASPWFTPTGGTSDLFSPCAGPTSYVGVPTNSVGNQVPVTGQGYAGAAIWSVYGLNTNNTYGNYREYLEVPLLAPLTGGQKYQVSFYVSCADKYHYAIAEIGACLTPGPLLAPGSGTNFNVVPQVENASTNILASTNSWMLVQGTFTAVGGESYLTLGNFRTDIATTYSTFAAGSVPDYAYYYFDEVSVVPICDPLTNKTVQCGEPWVFDNVTPFDNCAGNNVTATIVTTTNGFCPRVITRTWSLADQCGNSNTLTQIVTIVDTNPPVLLCGTGANLVPNPQFENSAYCPYSFGQVDAAAPWFNPTVATPDYLNSCTSFPGVSTPNNFMGSQIPFSGQSYCGAFVYSASVPYPNSPGGYREYIEAPLLSPLVAGVTYQVSFRVSLADKYAWAISQIGAHFSSGPILNGVTQGVLSYVPQVENPAGNPLTSTNSWMLVQGTFTAFGGEDHITLGNFRTDANTTAVPAAGTNIFAYYYYDDISVTALCNGGFTNKSVQCGVAWGFDVPLAFDACSGNFLSTTITSTTTNGVCPKTFTRIWTIADACNNSMLATQTVTEIDTTPPSVVCSGVNLVPNPSFENYANCPTTSDAVSEAIPWYRPTDGTSDYFNACAPGMNISVPTNFTGVQNAFTGQGYVGAFVYNPGGNNATNSYREYVQTPLLAPLIAGQAYAVSFYVSRADNYVYSIGSLGAHLSVGGVTNFVGPGGFVLPVVPQVENSPTNILSSTNSWMLVQGTFIAAGGENFLTLGNFRSDANTPAVSGSGYNSVGGYYYFDEVSVVALCQATNKIIPCGVPVAFDAPVGFDLCSGTNVTIVASTITNSLCPLSMKRTWMLTDLCGNSNLWSQTITVTNNSALIVNCACLQDACISLLASNSCSGIVPNLSVFSNSPCITSACGLVNIAQFPPAGTVLGPGSQLITLKISNCSGFTNLCEVPFFVGGTPPTITCPRNLILLTCNTGVVANFTPTATGNTGTIVCSPPSGSIFPLGNTVVTCTATNSCGAAATCSFLVSVQQPFTRWGCLIYAVSVEIIPFRNTVITYLATLPGGGMGVDFGNPGGSEQYGMRLLPGPADKFKFSTVLDFAASNGASMNLALPPEAGHSNGTPLLTFALNNSTHNWDISASRQMVNDPTALFRSIAIGTNGELFSSFTHDGASLDTNILASLMPMDGATNAQMTVTVDFHMREVTLEFPACTWTPNLTRKGWDGCIYGNHPPRGSSGNRTAKLILTPVTTVMSPPINALDLLASNLPAIAFDSPSTTVKKYAGHDGHNSLLKAYDDGVTAGMEFVAFGDGGGVFMDLGHAASFQCRIAQLATNPLPNMEEIFRIKGWPPGTTTNRPPPVFSLRLAQNSSGTGVDCSADFNEWGVAKVTVQLWNGAALVSEMNHVSATLASSLVTLGSFPEILRCQGTSYVSLSSTNPFLVNGLTCPIAGCLGTELRVVPEFTALSTPPIAFTELAVSISEGMDNLLYDLVTTPACSPVPLDVAATPAGIHLNWSGDGFHLQGAESVTGPWYDLGVSPPVSLPANSNMRVFRLRCE